MKRTYRIEVKRRWRDRVRQFIKSGFTTGKRSTARVLCLGGREALEVFQVYDRLGIPHENIVCLEKHRKFAIEIRRRNLGIDVRQQTLDELINTAGQYLFDIVSLDFMGQLATYANALHRLRARGLVDDHAIFLTNFCGAREADATKGLYSLFGTPAQEDSRVGDMTAVGDALLRGDLSDAEARATLDRLGELLARPAMARGGIRLHEQRGPAIHTVVRQMLSSGTHSMIRMLFRESDRDGSLTEMVRKFLDPDRFNNLHGITAEHGALLRQQLAAARKQEGMIPPDIHAMLTERVTERIRRAVAPFAEKASALNLDLDGVAVSRLLISAIDTFLGSEQVVLAAESYKYVSDGGTPMYADLFRIRRIDRFDSLRPLIPPGAERLDDLLKPIEQLSLRDFVALVDRLRDEVGNVRSAREAGPPVPERIDLGRECAVRSRGARTAIDTADRREHALRLLSAEPSLTIEDVALAVGADSTQQVAGWKAHVTMGTYPGISVEQLERVADRELEAGRLQSALEITRRLLRRYPTCVRLLTKHARILAKFGKPQQALAVIRKALEVEPSNPELRVREGNLLRVLGQHGDAHRAFEEAQRSNPLHVAALVGHGEAFQEQGKPAEAQAIFEKALEIDPSCYAAKFGRAGCLHSQGENERALVAFDDLVRQQPDSARAWYNRSIVLIDLHRRRSAIGNLVHAVKLDPGFYQGWFNLGFHLFEEGALDDAYHAFSNAATVRPGEPPALWNLAVVCTRLGKHDEAAEVLKQALKNDSADVDARAIRALLPCEPCREHERQRDFDELVELSPESAQFRVERGRSLLLSGRGAEALLDFDHALQLNPTDQRALMGRGLALYDQHEYEESVRTFDRLLCLHPDDVMARTAKAASLTCLKRMDEAVAAFSEAVGIAPHNPAVWLELGKTLSEQGRHDASVACLDRAFELAPEHPQIQCTRANALLRSQRPEEARAICDKWLSTHPRDCMALCIRGAAKLKTRDIVGARADFLECLRWNPEDQTALDGLSRISNAKAFAT